MTGFLTLIEADLWGTVLVLFGIAMLLHCVGKARSQMTGTDTDPLTEARNFRSE